MFKVNAKIETSKGTENVDRFVSEAELQDVKNDLRASAPAGSTVTIKTERV